MTVVPEGVAAKEKSARKMAKPTEAVCVPLVPVTEKLRGFAVEEERLKTVRVLDPPAEIVPGLKLHVAPLVQDRLMEFRNDEGAVAVIVNVAVVVPTRMTFDRALEDSVKTGLPVPVSVSAGPVVAFEVTATLPVALPVPVGVKLTDTVQDCPTFKDTGTVGKLFPQVLVSANAPVAAIFVMVTA
jgi:hypothetical protein